MLVTEVSLPKSPRIAVLLDHFESDYHQEVVAGVLRAARPAHARIVIAAGGWLGRPPEEPVTRSFIYDHVREARVDGLLPTDQQAKQSHCVHATYAVSPSVNARAWYQYGPQP
jgi:hypothetical protein